MCPRSQPLECLPDRLEPLPSALVVTELAYADVISRQELGVSTLQVSIGFAHDLCG